MIILSDKISSVGYPTEKQIVQPRAIVNKNNVQGVDTVSFSGSEQNNTKKDKNKNKLIAYLAGGLALAAGIVILAVKLKKGKAPSVGTGKDIVETLEGNSKGSGLGDNIESEIEKELGKLINEYIDVTNPKNPEIVREAFRSLNKNAKKLDISWKDYNKYFDCTTPENKDFVINEGITLIANNIEQIRKSFKNPEQANELLRTLNAENKEFLPLFIAKADNSGTDKLEDLVNALKVTTTKNKKIMSDIMAEPEKYKIHNLSDITAYANEIKPENSEFVFKEVFPLIDAHNADLNITTGYTMAKILGHITPETKDVIKVIADNSTKYKFDDLDLGEFIKAITPQNKENIQIVIDNAEKLDLAGCFDCSDYADILNLGKEGILKKVKDS